MKHSIRSFTSTALAAALAIALTSCAFPGGSQTLAKPTSTVADQALQEIAGQVFSKGPNGETAAPPSSADLSDEEVAKINSMGLKAATASLDLENCREPLPDLDGPASKTPGIGGLPA